MNNYYQEGNQIFNRLNQHLTPRQLLGIDEQLPLIDQGITPGAEVHAYQTPPFTPPRDRFRTTPPIVQPPPRDSYIPIHDIPMYDIPQFEPPRLDQSGRPELAFPEELYIPTIRETIPSLQDLAPYLGNLNQILGSQKQGRQ